MNEGQRIYFVWNAQGMGQWMESLFSFFAARSLNKEDENACIELIGNWKYFGICYFFHWLFC